MSNDIDYFFSKYYGIGQKILEKINNKDHTVDYYMVKRAMKGLKKSSKQKKLNFDLYDFFVITEVAKKYNINTHYPDIPNELIFEFENGDKKKVAIVWSLESKIMGDKEYRFYQPAKITITAMEQFVSRWHNDKKNLLPTRIYVENWCIYIEEIETVN